MGRGAWGFSRQFVPEPLRERRESALVEESVGVLARSLSRDEEHFNDQVERLIADNLQFVVHSMFFAQRPKGPPSGWPPANVGTVDTLLTMAPELPKFRGRVCYTHFNRLKTLAIISPTETENEQPVRLKDWEESPDPPLSEDSAIRRWRVRPSASRKRKPSCEFAIVIPTGDGVAGRQYDDLPTSGLLWKGKAERIETLLQEDCRRVQLVYWRDRSVLLPFGMRHAARSALLYGHHRQAEETKKDLEEAQGFSGFETSFNKSESVASLPEDLNTIVLVRSWHKFKQQRQHVRKSKSGAQLTLAGIDGGKKEQSLQEEQTINQAVKQTVAELEEELGGDAII